MINSALAVAALAMGFVHVAPSAASAGFQAAPPSVGDTGSAPTPSDPSAKAIPRNPNAEASETSCANPVASARSGGLVGMAPDGTGATTLGRDCVILNGSRQAAQIGRTIEISDGASGPASGPGISTADSSSYALSLVNVRPSWATSPIIGEADGLSIFVRQAKGDTAALLANVGVRSGFAATLESYTFAADEHGRPLRGVRTQLGVVNPRDGGEFGLLLQAADGSQLSAGVRIMSLGTASWKNYLEAVSPTGESVAYIRGSDGAIIGGDMAPTTDLRKNIGTPDRRYATTYTQVLQLAETSVGTLPNCGQGAGGGAVAFVSDARKAVTAWGQIVSAGGGRYKTFVKCDGTVWRAF